MVRSSRVDQPPVSGVPVAGATVGVGEVSVGCGMKWGEGGGFWERGREGEREGEGM